MRIPRVAISTARPRCRCAPSFANGSTLTSLVGYGLTYNTLDNKKSPTNGLLLTFGQDFAGVGGDVAYMRTSVDFHTYYEVVPDLVGALHLQAGNMIGLDGSGVRLLDDFKDGPEPGARLCTGRPRPARHHAGNVERRHRRHQLLGREPGVPISVYFLPKTPASAAPCSSMPARCGDTRARRSWRRPAKSTASSTPPGLVRLSMRHAICRQSVSCARRRRQHHLGFLRSARCGSILLSDNEDELRPHSILRLRRRNALLSAT